MQWESIQRIYRDGDTNKVVGDGDAFGSCVFQQPVQLVLTPKKKEPAVVEVGATIRLKDTSRLKCSLCHSS